ncbi:TolC family protein [Pseudodesulfovibrio sp. F-1]|uniref:TolC family protein n=2 Tax=Pseudodesulfovibrio alkaliphilus TaxID=2661613 RepID=A0A7K1KQZ8_9BACT|nr:TolC family protein [Pseudodesulfovibrio alkaliphilus]
MLGVLLLSVLLSACAVSKPPALSHEDMITLAAADHATMFSSQEPILGPVTLEEAVARAIKYNLQHRQALMERALASNLTDIRHFNLLPKLTAEAGYRVRDNDDASSSESINTGRQSLEPSKSRERSGETAKLEMTWNILDFGLSYFEAKAHGNKTLAAEERRRRVVSDIIRQTRAAYWAAVSAERMRDEVAATLGQARQALEQSREAERRRLTTPVVALRYQRDLLNMMRQIEQLDNELAKAKAELASLMNLAPGTKYALVVPEGPMTEPKLSFELPSLESLAMVRRPELREQSYLARNAVLETQSAMLRMFPNATLFGGVNYDSNDFLVNNTWTSAGVQVGWNLFKLLSLPAERKAGENRERVAVLRRQALRMTVLSQVHIAWHQRHYAQKAFERARDLCELQTAIREQTEHAAASKSETRLELIRTRVETLLAVHARDMSYAEMMKAQDAVYQAAGLDSMPEEISDQSVAGLASAIAEQGRMNELGHVNAPFLNLAYVPAGQANAVADAQAGRSAPAVQAAPAAKAPGVSGQAVAQSGEAGRHPAIRLVVGRPWEDLGSLQGD